MYPDRPLRGVCVRARVCVCVCWSVWQTIDHGFAGTSGGGGAAAAAGMEAAAMMACTCLQVKRLPSFLRATFSDHASQEQTAICQDRLGINTREMSRKREEFRCVLRTGAEPNHSSCIGPPGAVAHRPAQCAGLSQRWQRQQQQQRWQRRGGGGGGGCSAALRGVPSVAEYHRPQRRRRCAGCAQVQESQTRRGGSASVCVVSTPSIDAIRSFAEAGLGHTQ
eukprot:COSAG06_NODE_12834_length_1323_cov_1.531046_1_plen_222_part_00